MAFQHVCFFVSNSDFLIISTKWSQMPVEVGVCSLSLLCNLIFLQRNWNWICRSFMISKHCQGKLGGEVCHWFVDVLYFLSPCAKCENELLVCFASFFLGGEYRSLSCICSHPLIIDFIDNSITCWKFTTYSFTHHYLMHCVAKFL
jgi:hypothetical protein